MIKRYAMVRTADNIVDNVTLLDPVANASKPFPWQPPAGIIMVESVIADPGDIYNGTTFVKPVIPPMPPVPDFPAFEKAMYATLGIDLMNDLAKAVPSFFGALEAGLTADANKLLQEAVDSGVISSQNQADILALETQYGIV